MSYDAPPPPESPYGGSPYGAPAAASSGKGTWALVCGILGLVCCGPLAIVAIVLGRQSQAGGARSGTGRAGEILGWIGVAVWVIGTIVYIATR